MSREDQLENLKLQREQKDKNCEEEVSRLKA